MLFGIYIAYCFWNHSSCHYFDQPGLAQGEEDEEVVVMAEVDLLNESAIEAKKQLVVADTK